MTQHSGVPFAAQPDFLAAAQSLLPQGDAWPRDAAAEMTLMLNGFMASQARVHARAADLTEREAVPWHSIELLPAWEADYGLPDPCTPLNVTIPQRQAALLARIAASAPGAAASVFTGVAAALGYTVTVQTFTPAGCGILKCGDKLYSRLWNYVFQINVSNAAKFPFQCGKSRVGDPLTAYSGTQLTCVLNRIKPAYSVLIMNYP